MAQLSVYLFGPFEAARDGKPVTDFATDKVRALLAYLAVESDRPHRRESLAGLLWQDHSEKAARANLRRALADLRQAIGDHEAEPPFVVATRQTIELNRSGDITVDVWGFRDRLASAAGIDDFEEAISNCRGGFLEGFSIGDSPGFEEWAMLQREHLNREVLTALEKVSDHYEAAGETERALTFGRRQLELDPWRESAHRQTMRLLAASGRRSAAVAQYEAMRRTLAEDLDIEPQAESSRLYESIKAGDFDSMSTISDTTPQEAPSVLGDCPYRGLAAFREVDAPFFCGRDAFVTRMIEALHRRSVVAVIVGSSGSGKSSAVFAGLLPRLREEGKWLTVTFRPGAQPFHSLASTLLSRLEPGLGETDRLLETHRLAAAFRSGEVAAGDAMRRALDKDERAARALIVVDQAEELYTLSSEPDLQRRFLDALLDAVVERDRQADGSVVLLVALRADFMGQALGYRRLADTLQEASLLMGPMSRDELRAAIEQPAAMQGAEFEAGLVDRLLDDVGEEPGNLPMLEFALTLLWDAHDRGRLTHDGYESIGRVDGALARYADEVYTSFDDVDRRRTRHVFEQLVRPGEGTEDTRRVATRSELGDSSWPLVQHLADKRLVVTGYDAEGQEIAEVVHEALIQRWGLLRSWMDEDRTFRSWQESLRGAQRTWLASDRDEGALLRGAPLVEAESWAEERGDELSEAELEYVRASAAARQLAVAEREQRRRRTVVVLASGLVLAVALVAMALVARASAQREAEVNRSLVTAAEAEDAFERGETDLALALALEAVAGEDPPPAATRTLAAIGLGVGTRAVLAGHTHAVRGAALAPDGQRAFSGSCSEMTEDGTCVRGELILWDLTSGTEEGRVYGHDGWINDVAFLPDGSTAVSASSDGSLVVWRVETGDVVQRLEGDSAGLNAVAVSADGGMALSGSDDGTVTLWDMASGEPVRSYTGHSDPVTQVRFGPSSGDADTMVLSTSADFTMILWDLASGAQLHRFEGHTSTVADAAFTVDGASIVSVSDDLTLRRWDVSTGEETRQQMFGAHPARVAILPDGSGALLGVKADLRMWDLANWRETGRLTGHELGEGQAGELRSIEVSSDGRLALSAGSDRTLRVWNLSGQLASRRFGTEPAAIDAIAVSHDGKHLLSGSGTGELALWDTVTGEAINRFGGDGVPIAPDCLAFDPAPAGGMARALSCAEDPSGASDATNLILWDVAAGVELQRLEGHLTFVRALAFSPDGRTALTGSQSLPTNEKGDLILWDLETGRQIRRFDVTHDIAAIAVSDDGERAITGSVTGAAAILWDMATGEQIHRYVGHDAPVLNVAFVPEQQLMITASADGTLASWHLDSGEVVHRFVGHEAPIFVMDVSPDGKYVLSGSTNGTAILWDAATGEELHRLPGHTAPVFGVAFHPDGDRAYTAGADGLLFEWRGFDAPLDELTDWIRANRFVRELTCQERTEYSLDLRNC